MKNKELITEINEMRKFMSLGDIVVHEELLKESKGAYMTIYDEIAKLLKLTKDTQKSLKMAGKTFKVLSADQLKNLAEAPIREALKLIKTTDQLSDFMTKKLGNIIKSKMIVALEQADDTIMDTMVQTGRKMSKTDSFGVVRDIDVEVTLRQYIDEAFDGIDGVKEGLNESLSEFMKSVIAAKKIGQPLSKKQLSIVDNFEGLSSKLDELVDAVKTTSKTISRTKDEFIQHMMTKWYLGSKWPKLSKVNSEVLWYIKKWYKGYSKWKNKDLGIAIIDKRKVLGKNSKWGLLTILEVSLLVNLGILNKIRAVVGGNWDTIGGGICHWFATGERSARFCKWTTWETMMMDVEFWPPCWFCTSAEELEEEQSKLEAKLFRECWQDCLKKQYKDINLDSGFSMSGWDMNVLKAYKDCRSGCQGQIDDALNAGANSKVPNEIVIEGEAFDEEAFDEAEEIAVMIYDCLEKDFNGDQTPANVKACEKKLRDAGKIK